MTSTQADSTGQRSRRRPRSSGARRLGRLLLPGLAALALLAAACSAGSPGTDGGAYGAAPTPPGSPASAGIVDLRGSALGQTLVDGQGRTLYLFEADRAGKSECAGGCASAWPPYLAGTPQAGTGVAGARLGTTRRDDGGTQVTYGGHPLYYYVGDNQPGDATGQGLDQFGAKWYVLGANGSKIDTD